MKFDPMTGEPIEEGTGETQQPVASQQSVEPQQPYQGGPQQPYPGMPHEMPPQKKSGVKVGIIVAAAVCVVAIIALVIALISGVFMSDKDRLMYAIGNTFKEGGALSEVAETYGTIMSEEELTTYVKMEYSGVGVEMEGRYTTTDKQLWGLVDMTGYPELEATVTITDGQVQAATPFLRDVLFVYNYTEDNDGYLMQQLSEQDIQLINQLCTMIYESKTTDNPESEIDEKHIEALQEWYDSIEVEKLDEKEEFKINGKDKKCTGYQLVITEDMVMDLIDIYGDILEDYEYVEYTLDDTEVSMDEMIDAMKDEVDGMDDIEIIFYLDSNMLAAVVTEIDGEDLEILFLGGDYRTQNIAVEYDGTEIIEIECEMDDDVEKFALKAGGQEYIEYEYDTESGDFEAKLYDDYGDDVIALEGTFKIEKDSLAFEDGTIRVEGDKIEFAYSLKKGAEIETLEGDEIVDIGKATLEELQEVLAFLY